MTGYTYSIDAYRRYPWERLRWTYWVTCVTPWGFESAWPVRYSEAKGYGVKINYKR